MRMMEVYVCGERAGFLSRQEGIMSYSYDPAYTGPELSHAMPFADVEYRGMRVAAWFDNLLPDSDNVRRGMATKKGSNTFSLLERYGLDLPGAVQVVGDATRGEFEGRGAGYFELSREVIGERLRAIAESESRYIANPWATSRESWSLGGNQSKIALREFGGAWFACEGDGASNVIVKPGVTWLAHQALDECATMRLASMCGLPCARTRMEVFGGVDAIVVERYDRITGDDGSIRRIHQEDFCQVLSVTPAKKYAEDGGPSAPQIMRVLKECGDKSPLRFYDALLFNHFTASTDAHAKNYSLLHIRRGATTLAPLYDVASLAPYMEPRHAPYKLAMGIGGETRVGALRKTSIQRFARTSGLEERELFDRAYRLIARIREQLPRVFDEPDLAQVAGIDELASRFIPRINTLCNYSERNLSRTGNQVAIPDIGKVKPL